MFLSNPSSLNLRRAAAFTLSRMLATDSGFTYQPLVCSLVLPVLHDPFLHTTHLQDEKDSSDTISISLTPTVALSTLMTFVLHTDPSPTLISTLLSPIMPSLYTLSAHMERTKTVDPLLKESMRGLLSTWGRVVMSKECFEQVMHVLEGAGGDWQINIAGEIQRVER